jgi:hypothetical protein
MEPGTNKFFESAKTTVGSECNSKERIAHKRRRARGATRCPTGICPLAPPRIANTSAVGRPSRRRRFVANAMEFMLFSRSPIPGYGFIPGNARRWARERRVSIACVSDRARRDLSSTASARVSRVSMKERLPLGRFVGPSQSAVPDPRSSPLTRFKKSTPPRRRGGPAEISFPYTYIQRRGAPSP